MIHLALAVAALVAQDSATPPLRLVAKGDTVLVYLSATPNAPWVLYRGIPGGARTKLTAAPILRVVQPAVASGTLGTDLPMAMRAVRAVDESELLRRMVNDPFAGNVLTFLSRPAATVLGRLYVDAGVTAGATYEYRAVFLAPDGTETDRALSGRVRVVDVPPAPPNALTAKPGDHAVRLSWSYPKYRGDPADLVLGFHLYRAEGAGGFRRLTATPLLRNDAVPAAYTDAETANGVSYRYQLTAVDLAGRESAPTAPAIIAPKDNTPPAIPTELAASPGDGVIFLTWRMNPEPDVAGYWVERSTNITTKGSRLNRELIPAGRPSMVDTVPGATQFFYRVIAVDASGNASVPSNALSVAADDKTPPAPPSGVTISVVARRLVVKWTASPSRGVRGYYLYRGETPAMVERITGSPVVGTQYVDSGFESKGLVPGRSYLIDISALDSSFNESSKVRASVALVDDVPPPPPSSIDVQNMSGRYAEIAWSGSSALDVRNYVLTRSLGDSAVTLGKFGSNERRWRDSTVVRGRRYVYRLIAVDSVGNKSAAAVDTLFFRSLTAPPAPRAAAAKATPTGVVITWERVIADELVGYNVYRSPLPTGHFEKVTTTPVSALTFTDRTGKLGLFYIVRAIDKSDNESSASPPAGVLP